MLVEVGWRKCRHPSVSPRGNEEGRPSDQKRSEVRGPLTKAEQHQARCRTAHDQNDAPSGAKMWMSKDHYRDRGRDDDDVELAHHGRTVWSLLCRDRLLTVSDPTLPTDE